MMYGQKDGGALWKVKDKATGETKRTKKGDEYWTGKFTLNGQTVNIAMFYNKEKQNPNGPDFNITVSTQMVGREVEAVKERMVSVTGIMPMTNTPPQNEIDPDSIPW